MKRDEKETQRLADWAEGRLSPEEAARFERGLAEAGEEARAEAAWLRAFVRASEGVVLDDPPADLRAKLERRFDLYADAKEQDREPGLIKRLSATLSFDSFGMAPAVGVRSASTADDRQLVYATDAADIAINLHPRPGEDRLDLDGQVLPVDDAEPGSFSVQLLSDSEEVGLAATDDLGEFAFEAVEPGAYQMLVGNESVEILISPVELRA